MKKNSGINRREFLLRSALGGAAAGVGLASNMSNAAPKKAQAGGKKITVGMIGVGARAHQLMDNIMQIEGTEIVAVCDAYKGRIERAIERSGGTAAAYRDYKEIIARPEIDVVVVATPDHWHKVMCIDALEAGKDVYCEKPLTYTVDEGVEIVKAVKKTGRILQVGSQGMSSMIQRKAREIIRSGRLGNVTTIRATWNRNTASGAWIYPIPPDASRRTVDWDMFLGSAPRRPINMERFFQWRCFEDYSGGISTDLFVHLCTTIHFIMDAKVPSKAIGLGELYRWKESRDVPDTINGVLEYPEGFVVNLSGTFNNQSSEGSGFHIMGTKGSIQLGGSSLEFIAEHPVDNNDWIVRSWTSEMEKAYYDDPKTKASEAPSSWEPSVNQIAEVYREVGTGSGILHFQHFFDCVRTRKQPIQDAAAGHHAAACAHMINVSANEKRFIYWDYDRDTVKT